MQQRLCSSLVEALPRMLLLLSSASCGGVRLQQQVEACTDPTPYGERDDRPRNAGPCCGRHGRLGSGPGTPPPLAPSFDNGHSSFSFAWKLFKFTRCSNAARDQCLVDVAVHAVMFSQAYCAMGRYVNLVHINQPSMQEDNDTLVNMPHLHYMVAGWAAHQG